MDLYLDEPPESSWRGWRRSDRSQSVIAEGLNGAAPTHGSSERLGDSRTRVSKNGERRRGDIGEVEPVAMVSAAQSQAPKPELTKLHSS